MLEEPIVESEPKNEQSENQESAVSLFSKIKTKIFSKSRETSKRNEEVIKENETDPSLDSADKTEIKSVVETAQTETEKVVQEAQIKITQLEAEILTAKESGETIKAAGLQKEKRYQENKIKIAQKQEKLAIVKPETRQAKKNERNIRQKQAEQETFELQKEIAMFSQRETKSESNTEIAEIRKEIADKRQELQTAKFTAEKEKTIGQKAGDLFTNKEVGKRFVIGQVNALSSSLGARTIYSLPAWLWQKANVRGEFGREGLQKHLEKTLEASQKRKNKAPEGTSQKQEMTGLMKVVKMTKEGGEKNSVLRKELARIIKENRHENSILDNEESEQVKKLIEKHAETKINGLEVARDGLNSACVLGGAWHLRIFSKGLFDAANRFQRLQREAGEDVKINFLRDAIGQGVAETFQKLTGRYGKDKTTKQRGLEFAQAAGTIMSYYGMGALSLRPETLGADLGRIIDTFGGGQDFGQIAENMEQNILQNAAIVAERYLKIAETAAKPVNLLFGGTTAQATKIDPTTVAGFTNPTQTVSEQISAPVIEHLSQGKNSQVAELFNAINDNPENPNYIETHDKIFPGNEVVLTYNDGSSETVVVEKGDNLWNIAKAHNPEKISEIGLKQGTASQAPQDLQEIINTKANKPPLVVEPLVSKPEFVASDPDHQGIVPPAPQKIGQSALGQIDADTSFDYKEQHSPSLEPPAEQQAELETVSLPADDKRLEELFNGEEKNKDNIKLLKELSDPNDKASINDFEFKQDEKGQLIYKLKSENNWQPLPKNLQNNLAEQASQPISELTHEPILKNLPEVELPSALTPNQQGVFEGPFKDLTPDDISSGKFLDQAREDFPILEQGDDLCGNYLKIFDEQIAGSQDNSAISEFKELILRDGPAVNKQMAETLYKSFGLDTSNLDKTDYLKNFLNTEVGNWGKSDKVAFYRLLTDYQTIKELKKSL